MAATIRARYAGPAGLVAREFRVAARGGRGLTGATGATGPNAISGTTTTALNGLLTGTGAAVSVIAIPGGTTAFLRADGTFGAPPGVTFAATGTHVVVTAQQANVVPVAVVTAVGQTANAFEVRDSGGVVRMAVGPQAVITDLIALMFGPNRRYYVGTQDAGGSVIVAREGGSQLRFRLEDVLAGITASNGADLNISTGSRRVVICGREDGAASTVDLNRRLSDSSTGVGGTVRCWTKTGQTENAVEVVAPGGGSVLAAWGPNGAFKIAAMSDASAPNVSVYFSTTANKLVFKDSGGVVNNLY